MTSDHHTSAKFAEKRKPKSPIKFKIELNEEQKLGKEKILNNDVVLIRGYAGSGKTLLACQVALDLLFKGEVDKIVITRPTVTKQENDLGFLPGDVKEKLDPWLAPIYSNLEMLYDKAKIESIIQKNQLEIAPLAFMRGRTFLNSVIIIDEAQNVSDSQTELILGRLGKGSKMIFCGDKAQIDLKTKKESGIDFFLRLETRVPGVSVITLETNHRHEIVKPILAVYAEYKD